MGVKNSTRYSLYSFDSFQQNFFYIFPLTALTKVIYKNFETSMFIFFCSFLKHLFNIAANGNMKDCKYLGNAWSKSRKRVKAETPGY